jgi:hypothetical protein
MTYTENTLTTKVAQRSLDAESIIKDIQYSDDPVKIKKTLRTLISEVGKKRKFNKLEQFHLRVVMEAISDISELKKGGVQNA